MIKEVGDVGAWVRGSRVLEVGGVVASLIQVGCGTGLPSAFLLSALLKSKGQKTTLHLQDYNLPVLSLVTLPNLILAAVPLLPAGLTRSVEVDADEEAGDAGRPFDPSAAGSLEVTPALLAAFTDLLEEAGVELRFTYGDWGGMAVALATEEPYRLVLTAETIYAEDSMGALLDVLVTAARGETGSEGTRGSKNPAMQDKPLEDSLGALDVRDWTRPLASADEAVVLVAAKVGGNGGLVADRRYCTLALAVAWTSSLRRCRLWAGSARVLKTGSRVLAGRLCVWAGGRRRSQKLHGVSVAWCVSAWCISAAVASVHV